MQVTRRCSLRYVHGVKAKSSIGPEHVINGMLDINSHAANVPASQRFLYEPQGGSTKQRAVQLRIGGAQMLTSSSHHQRIYNRNEAHPLFFSSTSPKEAGLCPALIEVLHRLRIRQLTELQGALIPLLLKGKHVIAHAETGTGKSFGIALATANRIMRDTINHRLHTIIIVPTEELALQYDKWLKHFAGCASQISQPAIESIPMESQLAKLHNIQPNVLVGTCQRIADIVAVAPTIIGEKIRRRADCIILDEADLVLTQEIQMNRRRMTGADLVDRIYRHHNEEVPAQMIATSATIDGATAQKLNTWMRNDKAVRLTTSFVEHTIPETLTFYFFAASASAQGQFPLPRCLALILQLIFRQSKAVCNIASKRPKILIFSSEPVEHVTALIQSIHNEFVSEWPNGAYSKDTNVLQFESHTASDHVHINSVELCSSLHDCPDPSNPNRHIKARELVGKNKDIYIRNDTNISKLNDGRTLIGVGKYEASRGIHVSGVTHVIMYGSIPPASQFVHCAGRTGRMGRAGEVIAIFHPSQGKNLQTVCDALEIPFQLSKLSTVESTLSNKDFGVDLIDSDAMDDEAVAEAARNNTTEGEGGDTTAQEEHRQSLVMEERRFIEKQKEDLHTDSIQDPYIHQRILEDCSFFYGDEDEVAAAVSDATVQHGAL